MRELARTALAESRDGLTAAELRAALPDDLRSAVQYVLTRERRAGAVEFGPVKDGARTYRLTGERLAGGRAAPPPPAEGSRTRAVLSALARRRNGMTEPELAAETGSSAGSINGLMNRVVLRHGYATRHERTRKTSSGDSYRTWVWRITKEGRAALRDTGEPAWAGDAVAAARAGEPVTAIASRLGTEVPVVNQVLDRRGIPVGARALPPRPRRDEGPARPVTLTDAERETLARWAEGTKRRRASRARIVLACAANPEASDAQVADGLGVSPAAVREQRRLFAGHGLAGVSREPEVRLTATEREHLEQWARGTLPPGAHRRLVLRARIVLACARSGDSETAAAELGISKATVLKWRGRFTDRRLAGLGDT